MTIRLNRNRESRYAHAKQYAHLYNNKRWRAKRATQLKREPLCALCRQLGHATVATIADHVIPHKGNAELFWAGELQSLCKKCHDGAKKQFEMSGRMRGCDINGNPLRFGKELESEDVGPSIRLA